MTPKRNNCGFVLLYYVIPVVSFIIHSSIFLLPYVRKYVYILLSLSFLNNSLFFLRICGKKKKLKDICIYDPFINMDDFFIVSYAKHFS